MTHICSLGTSVASAIYFYQGQVSKLNLHKITLSLHFEWSIWFLTFGTNLWATGLIFIRAWYVAFDPAVIWLS